MWIKGVLTSNCNTSKHITEDILHAKKIVPTNHSHPM